MTLNDLELEPCADVILSAAARRMILTGGGGAPIDFFSGAEASIKMSAAAAFGGVGVRCEERGPSSPIFITSCTS